MVIVLAVSIIVSRGIGERLFGAQQDAEHRVPEQLEEAIAAVVTVEGCVTAARAEVQIRERLRSLGYADWHVELGPETSQGSCVGASIDATVKTVSLIATLRPLRPEVLDMLRALSEDLLRDCLTREQATTRVASALAEMGETDFEIATDGPVAVPIGQEQEVIGHVHAGCWVYSGTGSTPDGRRRYYVSGLQQGGNE